MTQVVILCGGLGTRLREETEFRPKPMVEIGGRPILWHIMKTYAHYGYTDFILCLGYKGEMIKEYFYNYEVLNNDFTVELGSGNMSAHSTHSEAGWTVTLADTGFDALKGARLKRVEQYIDSDQFMVTYGDGVADVDITALADFHHSHGRIATLTGVSAHARFGRLKLEGDRVVDFAEKPGVSEDVVNGGFFVFNREILDRLDSDSDCDLEYGVLEDLASEGELMIYKHAGFWGCMDTQRDMDYLSDLWGKGEALWKTWD